LEKPRWLIALNRMPVNQQVVLAMVIDAELVVVRNSLVVGGEVSNPHFG
jgi:hypothetical protein